MPAGVTSTYCILKTDLSAWGSGAGPSISSAMKKYVVQFDPSVVCPSGYTQITLVVGSAGTQPTIVAFDTAIPPTQNLAWMFALGFLAAFSAVRVLAMVIRAAIDFVRD